MAQENAQVAEQPKKKSAFMEIVGTLTGKNSFKTENVFAVSNDTYGKLIITFMVCCLIFFAFKKIFD